MIYGISKKFNLLKILTKDILDEAYLKLELDKQTIENSLKQVANNCIGKDDRSILDELNKEFKSSKIEFHKNENKNISDMNKKCPKSGIAYFESGLQVFVYVDELFFQIIKNDNLSKISELAEDLFINYSHEITHVEQNTKQKEIQPGINTTDAAKNADFYLSHTREIDAHAREVANYLIAKNYSIVRINYLLTTNTGMQQLEFENKTFHNYCECFGRKVKKPDKDSIRRQNIFKIFRKRIYDFLNLDS